MHTTLDFPSILDATPDERSARNLAHAHGGACRSCPDRDACALATPDAGACEHYRAGGRRARAAGYRVTDAP